MKELRISNKIENATKSIAIYGKGGIGKSTTTANVAAAASTRGFKTFVVGCDPKADSIRSLITNGHTRIKTILENVRSKGNSLANVQECIYEGFNGIKCVESGGPVPGVGCAGKGVFVALELLQQYEFINENYNLTLFDVLGDVVCGGFAKPMRSGFAKEVYIVTSGEFMSIYQAVNIASSISNMAKEGFDIRMAGIICNCRNVAGEQEIVSHLSKLIGVPVIITIPRLDMIQKAESLGKTVVEAFPDSDLAGIYTELAVRICSNQRLVIPTIESSDCSLEILDKIKKTIENQNGNAAIRLSY